MSEKEAKGVTIQELQAKHSKNEETIKKLQQTRLETIETAYADLKVFSEAKDALLIQQIQQLQAQVQKLEKDLQAAKPAPLVVPAPAVAQLAVPATLVAPAAVPVNAAVQVPAKRTDNVAPSPEIAFQPVVQQLQAAGPIVPSAAASLPSPPAVVQV